MTRDNVFEQLRLLVQTKIEIDIHRELGGKTRQELAQEGAGTVIFFGVGDMSTGRVANSGDTIEVNAAAYFHIHTTGKIADLVQSVQHAVGSQYMIGSMVIKVSGGRATVDDSVLSGIDLSVAQVVFNLVFFEDIENGTI